MRVCFVIGDKPTGISIPARPRTGDAGSTLRTGDVMTQDPNSDANFTVQSGEAVTVTLAAVKTACLTNAAFDGNPLPSSSSSPAIYNFRPVGITGDQPLFCGVCNFDTTDPADAHYTIRVSSAAGGSFQVSSIYKEAPEASFLLYFAIN